jgi:hypothetical protein
MDMCIRCGDAEAPQPLGYCTTCALHAKVELTDGFRRMRQYLAAWAAFDEWLRTRDTGPAAA